MCEPRNVWELLARSSSVESHDVWGWFNPGPQKHGVWGWGSTCEAHGERGRMLDDVVEGFRRMFAYAPSTIETTPRTKL